MRGQQDLIPEAPQKHYCEQCGKDFKFRCVGGGVRRAWSGEGGDPRAADECAKIFNLDEGV